MPAAAPAPGQNPYAAMGMPGAAPAQVPVLSVMANRPAAPVSQSLPPEYNVQMPMATYPAPTQVHDSRHAPGGFGRTPTFLATPPHLPHLGAQPQAPVPRHAMPTG